MTRPRRTSGGIGLLGLGGYGLGLCALGVAGIVTPLLQGHGQQHPGDGEGVLAQAPDGIRGPIRGLSFDRRGGGAPGTVLVAAAALPAAVAPSGRPVGVAGLAAARVGQQGQARAQFRPTLFVLPSGRTAQIRSAGLLSDGSLAVPEDPKVVGWWNGGSLAGEPFGSTVIAGHVDSAKYGLGAFAELAGTRRGAILELRTGDRRLRYRVTAVQKILQARMTTGTDAFRQDLPHRLVVITCGGPFDRAKHRYRDNIVITAVPLT